MEAIDNIKSIVSKHVVYLKNKDLIDTFLNQMNHFIILKKYSFGFLSFSKI